jgi:hypothetical protein
MDRLCQRSLYRPSHHAQTMVQKDRSNLQLLRPCDHRLSTSLKSQVDVVSSIALLLLRSSPIAILWRVAQMVTSSVNGVFRTWARSHIGIEIRKRLLPSFTTTNPTSPIIRERFVTWVHCSFSDTSPDSIFREMANAISGSSVFNLSTGPFRSVTTTTRRGVLQVPFLDFADGAAGAFTYPKSVMGIFPSRSQSQDCPSGKLVSGQVNKGCMGCHDSPPLGALGRHPRKGRRQLSEVLRTSIPVASRNLAVLMNVSRQ